MRAPEFSAIAVGDVVVEAQYGPLSIDDTVKWAASQEIWERLHFDREFAREHSGQRTFIASGAYRQAMLARMVTDWLGARGILRTMGVRHTAPTLEGDVMRFAATCVEKSRDPADPWIACDVIGTNQDGVTIMTGHITVRLPA
jgi:acyl dehydratase